MNRIIATFFLSACWLATSAETVREKVLRTVEENNPALMTMRAENEASYWECRSGITLSDPEVGFAYKEDFEATDSETTEFSLTQPLDLSVISGRKKKKALAETALNAKTYLREKQTLDLEIQLLMDKIVYLRKMDNMYAEMLATNRQLVDFYERSLKNGECSKLEYSRVRLVLADALALSKTNSLDLNTAYLRLVSMNGGAAIDTVGLTYDMRSLPMDFEGWFASVADSLPVIQESLQKQSLCEAERRLAQSGWWPKLSVGYELEKTVGANMHSATVGLSIPLWENRNSVRAAKLKSSAAEMQTAANRQQQHDALFQLHSQTQTLQALNETYHDAFGELLETQNLMKKAVMAGEVPMTDYLVEMATYYDLVGKLLDAEFKYQQSKTEFLLYGE